MKRLFSHLQKSIEILKLEGPRSLMRIAKRKILLDKRYHFWWRKHRVKQNELDKMKAENLEWDYLPTISLIVPVYNPSAKLLRAAIESVRSQVYTDWELCICDDRSTASHVAPILREYEEMDSRIKVITHEKNQHISGASNSALTLATGDYIALLDHDDLLTPDALHEVVKRLQLPIKDRPDILYSDEDKVATPSGIHNTPFFKPDWSPELLMSIMYIGHLGVYRRSLVEQVGKFRKGYEGSQDFDLALRCTEQTDKIVHIPKILYHWRQHPDSTAGDISSKSYVFKAAHKALKDALKRRGLKGTIEEGLWLGSYRTKLTTGKPLVSIIIPFRDKVELLKACLNSFSKSTYTNIEFILVDNESSENATQDYLNTLTNENIQIIRYPHPFNFSTINNVAAKSANGDYLLFLNNDTEIISPDWIEAMLEHAQRPEIAAVGAKLLYPNHTVQHAGVVMGIAETASHAFRHVSESTHGYLGLKDVVRNVSAVTAACLMMSKKVFTELKGFNENYVIGYQDVDLCLRALKKGYRNVYTPYAVLTHHESVTRNHAFAPHETELLQHEWKDFIKNDPFYNPNLTRTREDYRLGNST